MSNDAIHAIKTCMNATDAVGNTLSRDTVAVILSHLLAVDRLMWAVACGLPFKRRIRFAKQARERGSFHQFLWLLKRGCIDNRHHHKNVMHLLKHVEGLAGTKLVREYNKTVMMRLGEKRPVAKMNWLLAIALERDDDEFFKWCATRLQYKQLSHEARVIPKLLTIGGKVDLMQWLVDNGYKETFGTRDNVVLAFDSLDHKDELIKFFLKENHGEIKNHINIVVIQSLAWEKWPVIEWLAGLGAEVDIFTHLLRFPYNGKDNPRDCSRVANIMPELELAYKFKCKLDPIWARTLVDNKHYEVLQWLIGRHYSIPYLAMGAAMHHGDAVALKILAGAKIQFSSADIDNFIWSRDFERLRCVWLHDGPFNDSHLKMALRLHPPSAEIVTLIEQAIKSHQ